MLLKANKVVPTRFADLKQQFRLISYFLISYVNAVSQDFGIYCQR